MKLMDGDNEHDVARGPETSDERDEAARLWTMVRNLTRMASDGAYDGSSYGIRVEVRGDLFRATYWADEFSSAYGESGVGTDPVEAMTNMHDCTDPYDERHGSSDVCQDPQHRGELQRRWAVMLDHVRRR